MFEETIRELRKLDGTTSIPVSISSDEEGYFDRECPSEECLFQFKVHLEDWKAKVRDEEVFCPFCGHTADSTEWNIEEQIEHLKQAATAHLQSAMGNALKRDAARWNRRQPRDSFISITMKVDSQPQQVALPPTAAEPMRLKIACPVCECRYAVIGAAYFCPSCGHNAADQVFAQTIAGIRQSLALAFERAALLLPETLRRGVERALPGAAGRRRPNWPRRRTPSSSPPSSTTSTRKPGSPMSSPHRRAAAHPGARVAALGLESRPAPDSGRMGRL